MEPSGFLSYAHSDDLADDGGITVLRTRLSLEVQMQMGTGFHIFQDRTDIAWGQNWRGRIEESLNEVTFRE